MGHIVDTLTTGTEGTQKTPEFPYTEQVNQPLNRHGLRHLRH